MWGIGRFDDLRKFVSKALELGFEEVELNYDVTALMLSQIVDTGVRISSLHNYCPAPEDEAGRRIRGLLMSSLDEKKRHLAVKYTKRTIDAARSLGVRVVVVHSGGLDLAAEEGRLHSLFERGQVGSREYERVKEALIARREEVRKPHLEVLMDSLREVSDHAFGAGVKIGLEIRADYHDIPNLEEVQLFLSALPAESTGYWHDVGHAHRLEKLGFYRHQDWLEAFGDRLLGVHLHDCSGLSDHGFPGSGEIDLAMVKRYVRPDTILVAEFAGFNSEAEVKSGLAHLRELGFFQDGNSE